jgi:hypothetical protein
MVSIFLIESLNSYTTASYQPIVPFSKIVVQPYMAYIIIESPSSRNNKGRQHNILRDRKNLKDEV